MSQKSLDAVPAQAALDAQARHGGNASHAARDLGLNRSTFVNRLAAAERLKLKPSPGVEDLNDIRILKTKIKKLESSLLKESERTFDESIVRALITKLADSTAQLEIPAWVSAMKNTQANSSPGVPTLFLSDLHWSEVVQPGQINGVNEYNIAIAHERLHALGRRAVKLLKIISPKLDYPGLVLPLGGDMFSGNIHDELTATNEFNSMPALLDLMSELIALIDYMVSVFGKVFLPCVTGNHGRDTVKIWNKDRHATSFDWLLYNLLAKHYEADKRITFMIPDGPDASYRIYAHRYLLSHGDQFRGGDSMIGCLGPIIRGDHKKRSRNGQIDLEYDTMIIGHWHQYIHHGRVIVNGSLKGYDEYAYNNNFGFEVPQQALWITHPKHHITFRMPVYVGEAQEKTKTPWVSIK
jgi:hypothetical protein